MDIKRLFVFSLVVLTGCLGSKPRYTPEKVAVPEPGASGIETPGPIEEHAEPALFMDAADGSVSNVSLTRDAAILTALLHNRAIEVARFGPAIGETFRPEARAEFDPILVGDISRRRDNRPQTVVSTQGFNVVAADNTLTPLEATVELLSSVQDLVEWLEGPPSSILETETVSGSVGIQQSLPTGADLTLTGTGSSVETNIADSEETQGAWTLSMTQPLLRNAGFSVNLVALRQAGNRAAQNEHAFRESVLNTVQQVESQYWSYVLARELLRIREFAVTLADEQLKRNEDLLAVGRVIEADVVASQAEKASREADFLDAQGNYRQQQISMVRLLNPEIANPWELDFDLVDEPKTEEVSLEPDASEALALQYRPELAQTRLSLANLDLDVVKTKNGLWPRLDLVASYGRTSRGDSTHDITRDLDTDDYENYAVGVELQTPLLNRAERARHRRAVLTRDQAERSLADLEQSIAAEVRSAVVEADKQWKRIAATEHAVRSREEQLRVEQGLNEVGKTTNLDYLRVQRDLIQAQVDEINARISYVRALTALYAAEGTLLERRGISLENME